MSIKSIAGAAATAAVFALAAPSIAAPTLAEDDLKCSGVSTARSAEAAAFDHSLKLVFAREDGAYVGDVKTQISQDGEFIALIECDGPWLLADLPPGDYEVVSEFASERKSEDVTVYEESVTREVLVY